MRKLIRGAAPGAEESVSYRMPYYSYKGRLIYFALMRDWIGLYMLGGARERYATQLAPYLSGVSTARFPLDRPIPGQLVRQIVKLRLAENEARAGRGRSSSSAGRR